MLQQMRSMKMFVFWFVAIAFLVGFVFFGDLNLNQMGQADQSVVAEVNGEKVSADVYNRYVTQLAELERERFQRDELSSADYDRIEAQAWDGLVAELLVRQEAQRLGLRAGDEEIVANLTQSPPQFIRQRFTDESGQFDAAAFQAAVNDPGYDWGPDEQYLRSVLPSLKLDKMVRARAVVAEDEVRREFARRNQRAKVRYVGVQWPSIDLQGWAPGDAEVRAYYDAHPERFARGETVALELIQVKKKPSAADEEEVLDTARQLLEEEKEGEPFAELAEIYSDDASGARGGDVGWVAPSGLPEPLAAAAAALAAGQTSQPLRTDRGFVVLHADSVRAGTGGTEVKLRQILLVPKSSGETQDSLRTRALEVASSRADFPTMARQLGAEVQALEPIEAHGFIPGVGFSKRLVDWAFKAEPGTISDPVGTDDAILIARLVSKNPKGARPFEAARDQARYGAEEQAKRDRARAQVERVAAAARAGQSLAAAAQAAGLKVEEPAPFNFYENVPNVGGANEFTAVAQVLEPGQTSGVIETPTGAFMLQVISRDPFDETAYANDRAATYQSLLAGREAQVYEAWLADMRQRATIRDRRRPRV
jgi:peptidyl-prolyl cis-trans isomerase D